ncbi:MAG: Tm-1-like ATP-binding domain-containing protein [Proteobacteria bacterium]|nr:Tm-1-like ATP-binding domain-containing protein [Pseudomonadota bacterium]
MKKGIVPMIVLLGTLDTKGVEIGYIREKIKARGCGVILIDAGLMGEPQVKADISREEVARAGGVSLEELQQRAQKSSDRMQNIQVMIEGAARKVQELYREGKLDAILSVGGSMGTAIGAGAMKALPLGIPKLMVGTHFYPQYLGEADLTILQCPTDIMGLNPITNLTFEQAANAICAMAEAKRLAEKTRSLIAMTAIGVTTPAVMRLQKLLNAKDYDTVVFHGNSEVLDQLVEDGQIDGVLDFAPIELIRIFITRETPWRASRLESAGRRGLPQVIVPGGLDMIILRKAKDEIPGEYRTRKIYMHGPYVTAIRTTPEELKQVAEIMADKMNRATGPAAVVFPLRGFSAIDREGFAFYEPETDRILLEGLKGKLKKEVQVREVDAHIFDENFIREVARIYDDLTGGNVKH